MKSSNILLTLNYDNQLTDFGVSKIFTAKTTSKQAITGARTVGYRLLEIIDDYLSTCKTDLFQ
jgi:serine/threonine protein kinase